MICKNSGEGDWKLKTAAFPLHIHLQCERDSSKCVIIAKN